MKVFTFVYRAVTKTSSSVSIGLLILGIIASTFACNREDTTTLQQGVEKLTSSPVVPRVEQLETDSPGTSQALPHSNSPDSSRVLPTDTQAQNVQPVVQQKENGKLRLVNDTPYVSIVYIYASAEESYRYAYVPPCTTRELYGTYSNSEFIRLNDQTKFSIAQKSKREDDFFAIKISALADNGEQERLCEFNSSEARNVNLWTSVPKIFRPASGAAARGTISLREKILKSILNGIDVDQLWLGKLGPEDIDDVLKRISDRGSSEMGSLRSRNSKDLGDLMAVYKSVTQMEEFAWIAKVGESEEAKHLIPSTRAKIEAGTIEDETALKTYFENLKRDPDCNEAYAALLDKLIEYSPQLYQTFTRSKQRRDSIHFSPPSKNRSVNLPVLEVNNAVLEVNSVQLAEKLDRADGRCTSTRNNDPIFTTISDYSRPQFQKIPQ